MIQIGEKQYFTSPNWKLGFFWSGNFKASISSLRRNRWRSFFTMLGIVIGIASVVTIVSLGQGLKNQITGQIRNLGSNVVTVRPGKLVNRSSGGKISGVNLSAFFSASTLTDADIVSLSNLKDIQTVVPVDFVTSSAHGDAGQSDNLAVIGTSPDLANVLNLKLAYGSFFGASDDPSAAVLGPATAQKLFKSPNPFAHTLTIDGSDFLVHGVTEPTAGSLLAFGQGDFNSAIFIRYDAAKQLTKNATNLLEILVQAKPGANLDSAVNEIQQTLYKNHKTEDFTVLKQPELLDVSNHVVDSVAGFITGIAAVSLLVGGIGIMDIMLVAVSERTREIGIRKAIGATNRQILNQFLTEGLVLSLVGGIIGIALAFLINIGLRLYTGLHPEIGWLVVVLAVVVALAVGIVFSGAPALKAARKQPIDALRGE